MYRFFVDSSQIQEEEILITGTDVNHIKNVLRMKKGEKILISNGEDKEYHCRIDEISKEFIKAVIEDVDGQTTELPAQIYLYQGIPKSDKMQLIIQKAVELGVHEIIPVQTKRVVVKLDAKKEENKKKRWNAISESAAKQSKRMLIPRVTECKSFQSAIKEVEDFDLKLIPYEEEMDMARTKQILETIKPGQKIAVFIGPEGGFCESEIAFAKEHSVIPITLGKRILRTETAGLMILSVLMFQLEGKNQKEEKEEK